MALVRTKEYKRQQQLATSMYKNFGNSVHYYWAVMSTVMQAHEMTAQGKGALATKVLLPLAERMISKAKTDGIFTGPEHLRLNLLILELLENWEG
jgi:N-terminal acetyltransferase B complex non-catalytic subunit